MKIVIIGPAYPYRGGLATYNERLAQEFIKEGHDVKMETFTLQYPALLFPGKSQFNDKPAPEDLEITRTVNSINPLSWFRVGKRLANEKPDLVIFRYWLPFMAPALGTISKIIKKNNFTKCICLADNIIPHEKRPGDSLLTKYFLKQIDGWVAMSKSVCMDLRKFDSKVPIAFSPHPLFDNYGKIISRQEACKKLDLDPSVQYFLFFGFIRDYKGLDLLLESFADERLRSQNVKLIVAGEYYTNAEPYNELLRKHQLESHVIMRTDFIPDDEVGAYFCASDLIVQPYKHATQSGVTQVGYHFERPMLVTNVGGLSENIPHMKVGYAVSPNISAISNAMCDFITNNRKNSFEQHVRIEKQKYSWSVLTESFMDVFRKTRS